MEEVNNEKISFFKRVLISVKDFEKYKLFATEKVRKSIKYIFQLVLLFVIAIAVVFTIKYSVLINNTLNHIKNDLPNFTYNNGNLNFEEENLLEFQSNESSKNDISYKIIIDTKTENQEEIEDYKKKIGLYNYGILFLKDKIIITNSLESTQAITEKSYKELESSYGIDSSFNKEDLVNYINNTNINVLYIQVFIIIYVYLFMSYFLSILMDGLILGLLGYITAKIVRVKLRYGSSYSMALHALTLPILLNVIYIIVNTFTGFYIKYFDVMYTTISYIYMVAAILSMRAEIIKEQIQITKIKEGQQEIKEQKEVNQDKEEQDKEKENEKEENQEESKDNNIGKEAEGEA